MKQCTIDFIKEHPSQTALELYNAVYDNNDSRYISTEIVADILSSSLNEIRKHQIPQINYKRYCKRDGIHVSGEILFSC